MVYDCSVLKARQVLVPFMFPSLTATPYSQALYKNELRCPRPNLVLHAEGAGLAPCQALS